MINRPLGGKVRSVTRRTQGGWGRGVGGCLGEAMHQKRSVVSRGSAVLLVITLGSVPANRYSAALLSPDGNVSVVANAHRASVIAAIGLGEGRQCRTLTLESRSR